MDGMDKVTVRCLSTSFGATVLEQQTWKYSPWKLHHGINNAINILYNWFRIVALKV